MDITYTYIIYLIVFRLSIIIAGIISIILGYRLFYKAVWPEKNNSKGSSLDVKSHNMHFTLKNAAPGTIFALFGAIIICIMIASSTPELVITTNGKNNITRTTDENKDNSDFMLKMRNEHPDSTNQSPEKQK